MNITRATIAAHSFEKLVKERAASFQITPEEFYGFPGKEHYRLLSYLSSTMNGKTILDIGTHRGCSALALSTNPNNKIISFDIERKVPLPDVPNITWVLGNLWDQNTRAIWESTILGAAIIVLDIDPHDGPMEMEFYTWLRDKNYGGLVLCDDIWYFKGMRDNFWFNIPTTHKVDITALGHWSGTGVIAFQPQPYIWETFQGMTAMPPAVQADPWTIYTAYFDLTRMPDASAEIKARDRKHYFESARATFALDRNIVVYCEEDSLESLKALRPAHLMERTRFIVVDFEKLPLTKYRQQIIENRRRINYNADNRNTASYYLLCMARYALGKRTMDENPFGSTHFAWLNICIERMGYKNLIHLEDIFSGPPRDKVSTCYIDYIPKTALEPVSSYLAFGRCSLCSGFFTGRRDYFYEFCNLVEQKFLYYLERGYGHADEQLFSPVYFAHPELFDLYYGDYYQMITNYRYIYENVELQFRYVLPKSIAAEDWYTAYNACRFVWMSYKKGTTPLSTQQQGQLLAWYRAAADGLGLP